MGRILKTFSDGSFLEYDRGSFDEWCVYLTKPNGARKPPRDVDYFDQLKQLAKEYGGERIYRDYVRVYDLTGKDVNQEVLRKISVIAGGYGEDALLMDVICSTLYLAMIAEERKAHTRLGKRIKRLGIHKLLLEGKSVRDSANFTRGMGWRDIAKLCEERGF